MNKQNKILYTRILVSGLLLLQTILLFSQNSDTLAKTLQIGGSVLVTNKGISTVPNYTLGKPAAIFSLTAGKKLRFEPEFRFALEGRPWMFIFWGRYDLLKTSKWYTRLGVNYSDNFISLINTAENIPAKIIRVRQSLTGDLSQSYFVTKNYSIGLYYMYSYGFEEDAIKNMHYLVLRNSFLNIKISREFFIRFIPQFYYLKVDNDDGFYFSETLSLLKKNFPLSLSSIINQPVKTNIMVNNQLLWNLSLVYTFNNEYKRTTPR